MSRMAKPYKNLKVVQSNILYDGAIILAKRTSEHLISLLRSRDKVHFPLPPPRRIFTQRNIRLRFHLTPHPLRSINPQSPLSHCVPATTATDPCHNRPTFLVPPARPRHFGAGLNACVYLTPPLDSLCTPH